MLNPWPEPVEGYGFSIIPQFPSLLHNFYHTPPHCLVTLWTYGTQEIEQQISIGVQYSSPKSR